MRRRPALPRIGFALGAAAAPLLWLAVVVAPPMNHDVAALLNFTARWMDGEALYRDLLEVNPPLIFLLNIPALLLGRVLPGGPMAALLGLVLLACGASAWVAARVWPGAALERLVIACALPVVLLLPGYSFAQREHLMVVLALPYLVHAARRAEGLSVSRGAALAAALAAATGFALKPHFLAIPAAVEAVVLWHRRGPAAAASLRDPVPWAMAAVWVGYVATILLAFPDYPRRMLPLVWDGYLDLGDVPWWRVALEEPLGPALLALVVLLVPACRRGGGAMAQVLAAAGLAAAVAAMAQHKGFPYHALPARLLAVLLATTLAARWLARCLADSGRHARAAAIALAWTIGIAGMLGSEAPWSQLRYPGSEGEALAALFATAAPERRVLVLSPAIAPVYPALNAADVRNTAPAMTIWPLQAAYRRCPLRVPPFHDPAEMGATEAWFLHRVVAGFTRAPPPLLMVSRDERMPGCEPFDMIAYLSRDAGFAATLRRYRREADVARYRVWRRLD